jgi:hypothetical protein
MDRYRILGVQRFPGYPTLLGTLLPEQTALLGTGLLEPLVID